MSWSLRTGRLHPTTQFLRNQVPCQPINQPIGHSVGHSVDHSVDHSISISPRLLQPPWSRRVAVVMMMMMMMWWLGHAQNPFSGWCVTSQTVESRLTMRPSHPLLKSPTTTTASQGRAKAVRCAAQRATVQHSTASAVHRPSSQSEEAFSGSRARNSILQGLGLDNRVFCCGSQTAC